MNIKKGISLFELILVLVLIVISIAIILPILNRPRDGGGKRAVCFGNLITLQLAWNLYADDNNGRIVNGQAYNGMDGTNGIRDGNEPYWTGDDVIDSDTELAYDLQEAAIKSGVLFPYIGSVYIYRCPSRERGVMRTYTIVDSMNGVNRAKTDQKGVYIKNISDIRKPSDRIVFIDQGLPTAGSFGVYYNKEIWLNPPVVRHNNGMTLSFVDGHAEYRKWIGAKTVDLTRQKMDMQPESEKDFQDLYWFQKGVWGQLGYEPAYKPSK